jgi:hypothetical protein
VPAKSARIFMKLEWENPTGSTNVVTLMVDSSLKYLNTGRLPQEILTADQEFRRFSR